MDELTAKNTLVEVKKEALNRGYELILSTLGASMFPLLGSRNKIIVIKCDFEKLKPGDIILFKSPTNDGVLIAHRLIRKTKNKNGYIFITKGDTNFNNDKPFSEEAIIGKIIKIKKKNLNILLEGSLGKIVNKTFLLLSISRINYFGFILFRKLKVLIFLVFQVFCPTKCKFPAYKNITLG